MTMQTSSNGYALIEQNESFIPVVKPDTGGKLKIGYSHDLLPGESFPNGITQQAALALLHEDVAKIEPCVSASVPPDCTQNQYDALIDFTYECGLGALHKLLSHGWSQVTIQLPHWNKAHVNGILVELPGMTARRAAEVHLFNSV
jgi:lysozyme